MNRQPLLIAARVALRTLPALILGAGGHLLAGQVTLAWDPNSEADLAGYRLRYGNAAGLHDRILDVGNVTMSTVAGLQAGSTYWFVATAYNTSGLESDPSNEISYTVPNEPPTISNLPDQQTTMNAPVGPVVFTIADLETDPDQLVVSAVSGNPVLVPATGIVLAGTGANRTLTVTPAADQAGMTTITVSVSDGAATVSASFVLTVNSSLPPSWSAEDIGAPSLAGSALFDGTTFRVAGGGTGIGGRADQFHFAWQPLSGDGEITARVLSIEDSGPLAQAGVMIRETLNGNSRHTLMCVTPGKGFQLLQRATTGGSTTLTAGGALYPAPGNWVRLLRKGNTIRAYKSDSGTRWTQVGPSVKAGLTSEIHVGLAVTACNNLQRCTATFDNVTVLP